MPSPRILLSLLVMAGLAGQQPAAAPHRIGVFFWHDSPNDLVTYRGIARGLEQAGVGATFLERRADSDRARAKVALAELRTASCELVFAMGTRSALLAKEALPDVPVVFAAVSNPVASGVVPSWGPSGTNLCGASNWIAPASVLDVFALAVPGLQRLGVLRSADAGVVSQAELRTMREFLAKDRSRKVTLAESVAKGVDDIPRALETLLAQKVDAIWVPIDITIYQNLDAVQRPLGDRKVPLLTTAASAVRQGAVVAAVADYELHGRRAAALATRILRHGADPRALPVDRMAGSLVVANLRTARRLDLELPLSLLVLADELIDREARYDGK